MNIEDKIKKLADDLEKCIKEAEDNSVNEVDINNILYKRDWLKFYLDFSRYVQHALPEKNGYDWKEITDALNDFRKELQVMVRGRKTDNYRY